MDQPAYVRIISGHLAHVQIILRVRVGDEGRVPVVEFLRDVGDPARVQSSLELSDRGSATAALPPAMHQLVKLQRYTSQVSTTNYYKCNIKTSLKTCISPTSTSPIQASAHPYICTSMEQSSYQRHCINFSTVFQETT